MKTYISKHHKKISEKSEIYEILLL